MCDVVGSRDGSAVYVLSRTGEYVGFRLLWDESGVGGTGTGIQYLLATMGEHVIAAVREYVLGAAGVHPPCCYQRIPPRRYKSTPPCCYKIT